MIHMVGMKDQYWNQHDCLKIVNHCTINKFSVMPVVR